MEYVLYLGVEFLEVSQDVCSDIRDVHPRVPPHHRLAIWPNQELLKVPLDVGPLQRIPEQPVCGIPKALSNRWTSFLKIRLDLF